MAITVHAVGKVRRLPPDGEAAGDFVVTHDAVVRDVADQQAACVAEIDGDSSAQRMPVPTCSTVLL